MKWHDISSAIGQHGQRTAAAQIGGLDLDCAASRFLAGDGVFVFEPLKLASLEKAAVRVTGTTIL